MPSSRKSICFFPGRESTYVRNRVLLNGLKQAGLIVYDCSVPQKNLKRYWLGFFRFLKYKSKSDIIFIGFYGQFLVPLVRVFTRKKIIFDTFLSTYQTLAFDRQSIKPNGIIASMVKWIEKLSCQCADICLLDTEQHIQYFLKHYQLPRKKFIRSWLGAEVPPPGISAHSFPDKEVSAGADEFLVHFHGEFQALHGTKFIVEAAHQLPDIKFRMIGGGALWPECHNLALKLKLRNIEFIPPVRFDQIPAYMAKASVCLGIFGETEKTRLVIPFKVYEALALGKPVITADTPAIRELLTHGEDAFFCNPADPASLAAAILTLKNDPDLTQKIGRNGKDSFLKHCSPERIGGHIKDIIQDLCQNHDS